MSNEPATIQLNTNPLVPHWRYQLEDWLRKHDIFMRPTTNVWETGQQFEARLWPAVSKAGKVLELLFEPCGDIYACIRRA